MLNVLFRRRADPRATRACKCCGGPSPWFGAVDFSKSCEDTRGKVMPDSGRHVDYFRCTACGFLFSPLIDAWRHERVRSEIYNADYVRVDPDFEGARPRGNADFLGFAFGALRETLTVLDYGGGDGTLARCLTAKGFAQVRSFDPFHDDAQRPAGDFALVTAFEVVEHSPDPLATFADARALTADDGVFLFTTLVQPRDIATIGLGWWYAAPRNGHVSLHTRESLGHVAARLGWRLESFDDNLHAAYVSRPAWLACLDAALAALRSAQNEARPPTASSAAAAAPVPAPASGIVERRCRDGVIRFPADDPWVGRSLARYGEFCEAEAALLRQLLRPGDVVVEAGAHVGVRTIGLARAVGPQGRVIAFEPQRAHFDLLRDNLRANGITNVTTRLAALGAVRGKLRFVDTAPTAPVAAGSGSAGRAAGEAVAVDKVDNLRLLSLRLLKVDVGSAAEEVLRGATDALWRFRPCLYVANTAPEHATRLIALIQSLGYRLWWHTPALYSPDNFAGDTENVFGDARRVGLLCVPEEADLDVGGLREVRTAGEAPPG